MSPNVSVAPPAAVALEIGTVHETHIGGAAFQNDFDNLATASVS